MVIDMTRYGKRVYIDNPIKVQDMGSYICPGCHRESKLTMRTGYGFRNILSVCDKGHTYEIAKELYEKYKVGDRIRLYESTFGRDAVLRLDSYTEGTIIKSYPDTIDYKFDLKVDRCVMNGKEIKAPAWVIGSIHHGINHSSREVKLLIRPKKKEFHQITLEEYHKGEIALL